jgi:hypothetical protein
MTELRKAAERLLEALEDGWVQRDDWVAFELRQAIEQAEKQEPVCAKDPHLCWSVRCQLGKICKNTAPPKRKWVGLTDEEISNCWISPVASGTFTKRNVYEAIEAKLRERNT